MGKERFLDCHCPVDSVHSVVKRNRHAVTISPDFMPSMLIKQSPQNLVESS